MRSESHGGAWCPKEQVTTDSDEWLQVDLGRVALVTASGTQGRFGNGQGQEFAEAYLLDYWRPRLSKWQRYRDTAGEEVSPHITCSLTSNSVGLLIIIEIRIDVSAITRFS